MKPRARSRKGARVAPLDARSLLDSADAAETVRYALGDTVFSQGDLATHVMYVRTGAVKLSVVSKAGRQAVVAIYGPGDFFGEGCLGGRPYRIGSATAIMPSAIQRVARDKMVRLLHGHLDMSDRFISHLLTRSIRLEEDLIEQLFNSSEKRLAQALLLLARYGRDEKPIRTVPTISQDTLAEMAGTTRSRVNLFLKKFTKRGFIEYKRELPITINSSLLTVVLHD